MTIGKKASLSFRRIRESVTKMYNEIQLFVVVCAQLIRFVRALTLRGNSMCRTPLTTTMMVP